MQSIQFKDRLNKTKDVFEGYLKNYLDSLEGVPEPILSGIKYALSTGGKRIRPILALFTGEMFGVSERKIFPLSTAIEMIHSYSLVHDDLPCMDDDDLRRGKPTVHKVYGEGMAVLIGDALLNLSMEVIAENADLYGRDIGRIIRTIYANSGAKGMVAGQCVDLESEKIVKPTEERVKYLHLHKTSCLIKAPIVSAAIAAGAVESEIKALEIFADNLGLAFQITDDILDVEGDTLVLGKKIGSDEMKGKMTYPAVFGLEGAKGLASLHIDMAIDALNGFERSENLIEIAKSIRNRQK